MLGDAGDDQLTGGEGENTFIYEINLPPDAEENEDYKFGDDKITDFGDGDTLILGDLNGDNAFNDFTFEEVNGNTLITFSDGRGSILLEGVGRDQISFNDQTGQVTFTGNANPQVATDQDPQNPDLDDDDDDIFTIV
ncbi:MAG TPA: hypothetical protein DCS21_05595 [Gammaproteobacteria bacterium]|nr:hypothetical protein [Gammaproteobacteria bacterium]